MNYVEFLNKTLNEEIFQLKKIICKQTIQNNKRLKNTRFEMLAKMLSNQHEITFRLPQ